jgi:hypothetical protein
MQRRVPQRAAIRRSCLILFSRSDRCPRHVLRGRNAAFAAIDAAGSAVDRAMG